MAARSFDETEKARVRGSAAVSQSVTVVPRKRNGAAPRSVAPIKGQSVELTPARFLVIPVLLGNRPDMVVAWPGAVSVMAWS